MRVGFYIDNISFHEYKDDREELFNKPNAYKKIMSHLYKFLKLKEIDGEVSEQKVNFNQFLEFIDYIIRYDIEIFLKHNDESDYSNFTHQ